MHSTIQRLPKSLRCRSCSPWRAESCLPADDAQCDCCSREQSEDERRRELPVMPSHVSRHRSGEVEDDAGSGCNPQRRNP